MLQWRVRNCATKRFRNLRDEFPAVPDETGVCTNESADLADIAFVVERLVDRPNWKVEPCLPSKQAIMASTSAMLQDVDGVSIVEEALRKIILALLAEVLVEP